MRSWEPLEISPVLVHVLLGVWLFHPTSVPLGSSGSIHLNSPSSQWATPCSICGYIYCITQCFICSVPCDDSYFSALHMLTVVHSKWWQDHPSAENDLPNKGAKAFCRTKQSLHGKLSSCVKWTNCWNRDDILHDNPSVLITLTLV